MPEEHLDPDSPATDSPHESGSPLDQPQKKRFNFWQVFWLTFLVASLAYAWYSFYVPSNSVAWAEDFETANRQAIETNKPMILFFTGKWCVPCRIMKRQIWADAQVTKLVNDSFVSVAIDINDPTSKEVMSRYKVVGPPVTIVTDPKGQVLDWRTGRITKTEFLDLLGSAQDSK